MSIRTAALRRRAEMGSKGDGQWRGIAVVGLSLLGNGGSRGKTFLCGRLGITGDWGLRQYLQFKQLGEQDGFVARTALAAQTERAAEEVVLCTTSVADHAFAAHAALVHGVRHECAATTQLGTQVTVVDGGELDAAESEGALAAGRRTIPSTRAGQRPCTQRARRHVADGRAVT